MYVIMVIAHFTVYSLIENIEVLDVLYWKMIMKMSQHFFEQSDIHFYDIVCVYIDVINEIIT